MIAKALITLLAGVMGVFSAIGLLVFQGGIATISIENQEVDLFLPVPLAVADLALMVAPKEELEEARREIAPHRDLILAALDGLRECPDADLVDVVDGETSVKVVKEGDNLIVKVKSPSDGNISIKVPMSSLSRIVNTVAGDDAA